MFTKHSCIFERLSFDKFLKSYYPISILLVWKVLLIQFGGHFESEALSFIKSNLTTWRMGYLLMRSLSAFLSGPFALVLFFEYLRSHNGEKQPVERAFQLNHTPLRTQFLATALFYSAAFLCFPAVTPC